MKNKKTEKIIEAMNLLNDKYIAEADPKNAQNIRYKKTKTLYKKFAPLAASFMIVIGILSIIPFLPSDEPITPVDTGTSTNTSTNNTSISTTTKPITGTVAPSTSTNTPVESSTPVDSGTQTDNGNAQGGSHMGDELYSPYSGYVDTVILKKNTFSENYYKYMGNFDANIKIWKYNRPAVLYYLAQEMKLTREDLEIYFNTLGDSEVPENIYKGLLADTLGESMTYLKTEYAFYNDNKLYTIYDIYDLFSQNKLDFDIGAEEFKTVWISIKNYINSKPEGFISADIEKLVEDMIESYK